MFKALLTVGAIFAAYKFGEYQAQINANDYVISNVTNLGNGVQAVEYLRVSPTGMVFTQDAQLATHFLFQEATRLKELLRKHIPNLNLVIETVGTGLITQTQNV